MFGGLSGSGLDRLENVCRQVFRLAGVFDCSVVEGGLLADHSLVYKAVSHDLVSVGSMGSLVFCRLVSWLRCCSPEPSPLQTDRDESGNSGGGVRGRLAASKFSLMNFTAYFWKTSMMIDLSVRKSGLPITMLFS